MLTLAILLVTFCSSNSVNMWNALIYADTWMGG